MVVVSGSPPTPNSSTRKQPEPTHTHFMYILVELIKTGVMMSFEEGSKPGGFLFHLFWSASYPILICIHRQMTCEFSFVPLNRRIDLIVSVPEPVIRRFAGQNVKVNMRNCLSCRFAVLEQKDQLFVKVDIMHLRPDMR